MTTIRTYNTNDDTQTGWYIQYGPRRAVCTYRSRWQGSRAGTVITIHGDVRTEIDRDAETISNDLADGLAAMADPDAFQLDYPARWCRGTTGTVCGHPARITDTGYTVA